MKYREAMTDETTISAGDIAGLAGVGRAAVSNWRRRYADFPRPVGGTAASPRFALPAVERWLHAHGKPYRLSAADRAWQALRAADRLDDLRLGRLVGRAGAVLLRLRDGEKADAALAGLPSGADGPTGLAGSLAEPPLAELAVEHGHRDAFEALCERYLAAHARQVDVTRAPVAALMARLVRPADGWHGATLLDPACGVGTLPLATSASRVLAQDLDPATARIAALRLLLHGVDATVVAGDALRDDGFAGAAADAVLCDPPFNERAWGQTELANDPRWAYGLPPRGESELAWVQHCLAHARPGGLVAVLVPGAVAGRRPGRRMRANLLRAGALRAVVTLPQGPDLWLLRHPAPGERPPARLLLMVAEDDLPAVDAAWRRCVRAAGRAGAAGRDEGIGEPDGLDDAGTAGPGRLVGVIDLLDDEVDLTPARHIGPEDAGELGRDVAAALARYTAVLPAAPDLDVPADRRDAPVTTLGELARAGLVAITHAPARPTEPAASPAGSGEAAVAVLTVDDLAAGRPASGRAAPGGERIELVPGDVVASAAGDARVVTADGTVLGPYLTRYRVDPRRLDPAFLAGALRAAATVEPRGTRHGSSRLDARRTRVPRLPLDEQRAYGRAFRRLAEFEDALRAAAEAGRTLVRLGFEGLADGRLGPSEPLGARQDQQTGRTARGRTDARRRSL